MNFLYKIHSILVSLSLLPFKPTEPWLNGGGPFYFNFRQLVPSTFENLLSSAVVRSISVLVSFSLKPLEPTEPWLNGGGPFQFNSPQHVPVIIETYTEARLNGGGKFHFNSRQLAPLTFETYRACLNGGGHSISILVSLSLKPLKPTEPWLNVGGPVPFLNKERLSAARGGQLGVYIRPHPPYQHKSTPHTTEKILNNPGYKYLKEQLYNVYSLHSTVMRTNSMYL